MDDLQNTPKPLSIRQNTLWNSTGSIVFLTSQWLMTVLVVRLSDSYEAAGTFALAMAVFNTLQPLAVYRMYTYQVSDVDGENELGEYVAFSCLTCGISLVLWLIYTALTCPAEAFVAVMLYVIARIARLLIDVLHAADQLNGRMDYIGISNGLQGIVTLGLFVLIFHLTGSLELVFLAMFIATVAIGLVYDLPRTLRFGKIKVGISWVKAKYLLVRCFPIVLGTVAIAAAQSVPRQYFAFTDGEAALGIYATIATPAVLIQTGIVYIYSPVLTSLSTHIAHHEQELRVKLMRKTLGLMGFAGIMLSALLAVFSPWLFELLFGKSILAHLDLLIPVLALTLITGFVWFFNDVLIIMRDFRGMASANVIAFLVSISSAPVLISIFEANGVSFSCGIAYVICLVIMLHRYFSNTSKRIAPSKD